MKVRIITDTGEDEMTIEVDGKEVYYGYQGFDNGPVVAVARALGAEVEEETL